MELLAYERIHMGKEQVHIALCKIVKGRGRRKNGAEKGVVVFNMRLLVGRVGIAEKDGRLLFAGGIVFEGGNAAEFSAIVRKQSRKELAKGETQRVQPRLEGGYPGCSLSRRLIVQQQAKHKIRGNKLKGHDYLSAGTANDRIHFGNGKRGIQAREFLKILKGTADPGSPGNIGRRLAAGLEFHRTGQVKRRSGAVALVDVAVDAALRYVQVMGMNGMINALPGTNGLREKGVHLVKGRLLQRNPLARFRQRRFILLLRRPCRIYPPDKATAGMAAFGAAIADEGRLQQQRAGFLQGAEAAAMGRASRLYLAGNGSRILADAPCDGLEGHPTRKWLNSCLDKPATIQSS